MTVELNFHQLRLFYVVAKSGSISQAARALRIAQPSVSVQLREFEHRCGVELLRRAPRGVTLTDAGGLLFDYAERIFALADELQTALLDHRGVRTGQLTIGGSLTAGEYFLPAVLKHFKECYPAVEPVLVLDNSTAILSQVERRKLDLGFVGTDAVGSELVATPCWQDEIVIIAAPSSSLLESERLPLSCLQFQVFVMREPGSATRRATEQYLQKQGLTVKTGMTVGSPEAVKRHVVAGLGWGFASKRSVANEVAAGQLAIVPIDGWDCRRSFYAAQRKDHRLTLSQQRFLVLAQSLDVEPAASATA